MPIGVGSPTANIKIVQNLLSRLNAYAGPIDGKYNDDFINTLFLFQKANGIVQNRSDDGAGTYGPKTRAMLKALLSGQLNKDTNTTTVNSTATDSTTTTPATDNSTTSTNTTTSTTTTSTSSDDTRALQQKLKDLGYFQFEVDGIYNKRLVDAIYAFQLEKKIVTGTEDPGAGYYGSVTQSTLEESAQAFAAKKGQIVDLETKLDVAKQARDEALTKKQQEFTATVKKIPTVKLNQVHPEIRTLQKILKQVGFFNQKDTAIFGSITKAALAKYQLSLKVIDSLTDSSAGVLGDKTREAIANDLYARWLKTDTTSNIAVDKAQKELDDLKKS